ncbi:MAG: hypothetical protein NT007_02905 [Candidatus Kapabacteria bacterium]|nr:hypothetical protein [Candidatus Kapabacteria bacterium]
MTKEEIINLFNQEFDHVKDKFNIFDFALNDPQVHAKENPLAMPGVYVFWKDNKVLRIGRHLINSRKRAFEHFPDNTGDKMIEIENDPQAHLLLFNLKKEEDKHWAAALEIFFELNLNPTIPSEHL